MRKLKYFLLISVLLSLFANCKDDKKDDNLVKGLVVGAAAGSASAGSGTPAEKMSRIHFTLIDEITTKPIDFSKIATLKIVMGDIEKSYSKTANGTINLTATNPVGSYGDFTFDFITGIIKTVNVPVKRDYVVHITFDASSYADFRSVNASLWTLDMAQQQNPVTNPGQSNGTAQQIDPTVKEAYFFSGKITPTPTAPAYTITVRKSTTGELVKSGTYRVKLMSNPTLSSNTEGRNWANAYGYTGTVADGPVVASGTVDTTASTITIPANTLIRTAQYKVEVYGATSYADLGSSGNFTAGTANIGSTEAQSITVYLVPNDATNLALRIVATSNLDNACNPIVVSNRAITYTFNQPVEVDTTALNNQMPYINQLFSVNPTGITVSNTFSITTTGTSSGVLTVAASGNTVTVTMVATEAQLTTACTAATQSILGMTLSSNTAPSTCTNTALPSSGEISYTINPAVIKVRRKSMTAEGQTTSSDYQAINLITNSVTDCNTANTTIRIR